MYFNFGYCVVRIEILIKLFEPKQLINGTNKYFFWSEDIVEILLALRMV